LSKSGTTLTYSKAERILGVHVRKWNERTDIARAKAAKVLSLRTLGCTPRVKRLAYQTMVKPLMFYGTLPLRPTYPQI
jgi:hypothetical protein